ncbi:uncharacterized protein L203_103831 [Cryptococcus depauperatus CBS 7841]|uniref:Uncharacterized protein n=1 Tax=Cryptococcus depauperatus CBS 7841 TaxID=1295531 RepID=A0A1E3IEN8_9TREE|nr:hypothetical protein L203_03668 [Cryptococcus depauperatus CBS 7841]
MYAVILAFLPASIDLLYHSYLPHCFGPSILSTVVMYDTLEPLLGGNGVQVAVDMAGRCWVGDTSVQCAEELLGRSVPRIIPFLASYQISYGLLVFSLFSAGFYTVMCHNKWANKKELIVLRRMLLNVMIMKDFMSICGAIMVGCALMIAPLLEHSAVTEQIIDVSVGWGFICTVVMAILGCFFTLAFENNSHRMLSEDTKSDINPEDMIPNLTASVLEVDNGQVEKEPLLVNV